MISSFFYIVLSIAVLGHSAFAIVFFRRIRTDQSLTPDEKARWKIKALVFPAYYWFAYHKK